MQIVIDIDEDTYKDIKRGKIYTSVRDVPQESVLAIANGTPLPTDAVDRVTIKEYLESYEVAQPKMVSSSENPNKWVGADVLNHWIGAEVLDKIRSEILGLDYDLDTVEYDHDDMAHSDMIHTICREEVLQIIDKYIAEGSDKE